MGGEGKGGVGTVLDVLKECISPEYIRALSPAEGLEVKPHTFQAVESEGRWKFKEDFPDHNFEPPDWNLGVVPSEHHATILTINVKTISEKLREALRDAILLQTLLPMPLVNLLTLTSGVSMPGLETRIPIANLPQQFARRYESTKDALKSLKSTAAAEALLPQIDNAITLLTKPAFATIEAVWWSDGLEIYAGQVAAKHVTGFGSLYGHQAKLDLDGVPWGNYFPCAYCVTFTGYVNPLGPTFEELRGAVVLHPDGTAKGQFCERSNRDKKEPEPTNYSGREIGYNLDYESL